MSYDRGPPSAWSSALKVLARRRKAAEPLLEVGIECAQLDLSAPHFIRHFDEDALPPRHIRFEAGQGVERGDVPRRRAVPARGQGRFLAVELGERGGDGRG